MPLPPPPMSVFPHANRRTALRLGVLGLAGWGASAFGQAAVQGFTHGVASGEPGARQVLLWTRHVAGGDTRLVWEMSESMDFTRPLASGEVLASPARDYCAKAVATGLTPGRWYYFRFVAPSGEISCVGRTRTLPEGPTDRFRLALFSCSNYGFGHFNAYAHAAEAGDFDLAVHVGDYLYEYHRGEYPNAKEQLPGREADPANELIALADYRLRYAQYRTDPDLRRLHQLFPMVAMWDDHETANDTWKGGAENHQSDKEGDWALRKRVSEQAWREWMPVSDDYWARYDIGDLASLFRLETRHVARDKPIDLVEAMPGDEPGKLEAALAAFKAGAWRDPARTLLGAQQENWLAQGLAQSRRAGRRWQVLAQQVIMGELALPTIAAETMPATVSADLRARIESYAAASRAGVPLNMDAWDGYPGARDQLYRASLAADADLIVLAGDSHNAWAFDLDRKGERIGVEVAVHSVTSPGTEDSLPWVRPDALARASVERNPQLKWCETARRGYAMIEMTPQAAIAEWRFLAGVRERGTSLTGVHRMTVLAGARRYSA